MFTPDQYLQVVAERVQRSGGRLSTVQIGPVTAAVGLFTESIMLSTMNYCVVAAAYPEIDAQTLFQFTNLATQHARANVQGTVGWTATSVVIAGLVGRVHPDAATAASAKTANQFGGETRMVAVDPYAGMTYAWVGGKVWGAAVQGSVNAKLLFCFPQPTEAYQQLQWQAQWQALQAGYSAGPGAAGYGISGPAANSPGTAGYGTAGYGANTPYAGGYGASGPAANGPGGAPYGAPGPASSDPGAISGPIDPAAGTTGPTTGYPGPGGFPGQQIPPGWQPQIPPPPAAGPPGPQPPHYPPPGRPPYGQ
ncbi:hypothetical protein ABZU76_06545 [Amycolatopsis sp. NPDC005232]|uniref:hypothetical protein n=1 Tax=Amycolatopsis sp. NPDC005232 TaxID=3157027 RepID=UPI0033AD743D